MSLFAFLLVLGAVFSHAGWNFFVKSSSDRLAGMVIVLLPITLVGFVLLPFVPLPKDPHTWRLIGFSALLHWAYNINLWLAYRYADLSLAYPLARGSVPLLVLGLAYWSIQELPPPQGMVGIGAVACGIMLLSLSGRGGDLRGLVLALTTSLWIAGYTVVDGIGVRHPEDALSFLAWAFAAHGLVPLVVIAFVWRGKMPTGFWRSSPWGLLSPLAYGPIFSK